MLPEPQGDWALFLDVDGTLVEIAETPDGVQPDKRIPAVLSRISALLDGAVALISGRPVETLDAFFTPLRLPAAGLHGLEHRSADGKMHHPPINLSIRAVADAVKAFAREHSGILIEDKGATVAIHYRQNPALQAEVLAFAEAQVAESPDATLQKGKMVAEIRPTGSDKGTVIRSFMAEPPFHGRLPVFIGDDVTDEAGFAAVNDLGGHSIRVGPPAQSAARFQIASVPALLEWLAAWAKPIDS